jgi:uncharacterized membrane protein
MSKTKTVHTVFSQEDIEENRIYAVIAYFWLLFLVPLLVRRESPYAQFHATQGLILAVAWFIASILHIIPVIGQVAALALFIINVMAVIKAWNGEAWRLPYLSDWAERLNF